MPKGNEMNTRRQLLAAFGAGAVAIPLSVFAQASGKTLRVGFLYYGSRQSAMDTGRLPAFIVGLREIGYVEGKNLVIEARYGDGIQDRLEPLAAELVKLKVEVTGTPAIVAAKRTTTTVPIVFTVSNDPVGDGFAASLAHPGGNLTGLSTVAAEVVPKYIELMKLTIPKLARVAALANRANLSHPAQLRSLIAAGDKAGVKIIKVEVRTAEDIERGFVTMSREHAEAVLVFNDTFLVQNLGRISELALKNHIASIFASREYARAGGFMTYGPDLTDNFRRASSYIDKIFKGAKPGDLPVEQPTRYYLIINRKTANALKLNISKELLLRADEVIE
jgi:putative tryptophan/tyrosine transport system substrate-binding protein